MVEQKNSGKKWKICKRRDGRSRIWGVAWVADEGKYVGEGSRAGQAKLSECQGWMGTRGRVRSTNMGKLVSRFGLEDAVHGDVVAMQVEGSRKKVRGGRE